MYKHKLALQLIHFLLLGSQYRGSILEKKKNAWTLEQERSQYCQFTSHLHMTKLCKLSEIPSYPIYNHVKNHVTCRFFFKT